MIINIVGIPGAGKTTLAKQLSKEYKLRVLSISDYRNRYHHELTAWQKMAEQVSHNIIIDTSGLNKFLSILLSKIKDKYITILLKCTIPEAAKRNKGDILLALNVRGFQRIWLKWNNNQKKLLFIFPHI